MTRFEQEISGKLGDYWKRSAFKELENLKAELESGKITIKNGIAYNCIGRVVMSDILEKLVYVTDKVDVEATKKARDEETSKELKDYREMMKDYVYSDEELFEMRTAFGSGEIVDVITGQTIRL